MSPQLDHNSRAQLERDLTAALMEYQRAHRLAENTFDDEQRASHYREVDRLDREIIRLRRKLRRL